MNNQFQRGVNNMEDPAAQERIRRGSHSYDPAEGKHGAYVTKPYRFQAYPKMMARIERPDRKAFKTELDHEAAVREWQTEMDKSIVQNVAEEKAWLATNEAPEPAAAKSTPAKKLKSRSA